MGSTSPAETGDGGVGGGAEREDPGSGKGCRGEAETRPEGPVGRAGCQEAGEGGGGQAAVSATAAGSGPKDRRNPDFRVGGHGRRRSTRRKPAGWGARARGTREARAPLWPALPGRLCMGREGWCWPARCFPWSSAAVAWLGPTHRRPEGASVSGRSGARAAQRSGRGAPPGGQSRHCGRMPAVRGEGSCGRGGARGSWGDWQRP